MRKLAALFHLIDSNDFPACHEEGDSVVYVDDDADCASDDTPEGLQQKIQKEANLSAEWLADNRLCVAEDKTKLMVIATKKLKEVRHKNSDMEINLNGEIIKESKSQKLLGVVINNELTWKNHLYGDEENMGLIPQLNKRAGMVKRLAKYVDKSKLKCFVSSIFYSKLNYCLPVFGNIFRLGGYNDTNKRSTIFTKRDNHNLQVLQNKVNRILTNSGPMATTAELIALTDSLSVHQMIAYQTATFMHKVVISGKPKYIFEKIKPRRLSTVSLRHKKGSVAIPKYNLSVSREGVIYRGGILYNKLPEYLRNEQNVRKFQTDLKGWIKENIAIKPFSKYPSLFHPRK